MERTIYDRMRELIEHKGITSEELAEKTGIKYTRWTYVRRKSGNSRGEEVEALCKLFPEYALWITTETTHPEAGQISPELDRIVDNYEETGMDTQ